MKNKNKKYLIMSLISAGILIASIILKFMGICYYEIIL